MLKRLNLCSFEFITSQYDYIVQSNNALSPLQGRGRVNSEVSAIKPLLNSNKGAILSYGMYPSYSETDAYKMAAASLDNAVRNIITAGGNMDEIYLLDNFCWCEGNNPERLYQLKMAVRACYDLAVKYNTPFISGKDSMFNDFKGFDECGKPVKISIPPTLLISSLGIIDDVKKLISLDVKSAGDYVYILGETYDEMGGSEYLGMLSDKNAKKIVSKNIPVVDADRNISLYKTYQEASDSGLISSAIGVGRGGLAVALAKSAMGGLKGLNINLKILSEKVYREDIVLFSESQGRILVTVPSDKSKSFENIFRKSGCFRIGEVSDEPVLKIKGFSGKNIINADTSDLLKNYRSTFKGY